MTIKELKDYLCNIPENMQNLEVQVSFDRFIRSISKISFGVDVDTQRKSLWLIGEDRYG